MCSSVEDQGCFAVYVNVGFATALGVLQVYQGCIFWKEHKRCWPSLKHKRRRRKREKERKKDYERWKKERKRQQEESDIDCDLNKPKPAHYHRRHNRRRDNGDKYDRRYDNEGRNRYVSDFNEFNERHHYRRRSRDPSPRRQPFTQPKAPEAPGYKTSSEKQRHHRTAKYEARSRQTTRTYPNQPSRQARTGVPVEPTPQPRSHRSREQAATGESSQRSRRHPPRHPRETQVPVYDDSRQTHGMEFTHLTPDQRAEHEPPIDSLNIPQFHYIKVRDPGLGSDRVNTINSQEDLSSRNSGERRRGIVYSPSDAGYDESSRRIDEESWGLQGRIYNWLGQMMPVHIQ